MEDTKLILVDSADKMLGYATKHQAHLRPLLHRAFSVVLYHENKALIQKRALHKYHSGGLWANTCCSHPRTCDTKADAILRLKEEVGIDVADLDEVFSFVYYAKFNDALFEYEYDHVFLADWVGEYKANPDEVDCLKWVDIDTLCKDMTQNPQNYAVWFLSLMPRVAKIVKSKNATNMHKTRT